MGSCGLSNSTLNRQAYRQMYGITPAEDQLQAEAPQASRLESLSNTRYFHFTCPDAAIEALQDLLRRRPELARDPGLSITLTVADSMGTGSTVPISMAEESTLTNSSRPAASEGNLPARSAP
jgi:hypothetical protein